MKMKTYRLTNEEAAMLKKMEQASGLNGTQLYKKKMFQEQQGLELLEIKMTEEIRKLEDKIDLHFANTNELLKKLLKTTKAIKKNGGKKR